MKLRSIIFTLLLVPQLAFASNQQMLGLLVEDFSYAITVEWDQQDQHFFESEEVKFKAGVESLLKAGLTKEDVIKAFPGTDFKSLEQELTLLNLSEADTIKKYIERNRVAQNKGASWNGEAVLIGAGIVLGISLIVLFIKARQDKNKAFEECVDKSPKTSNSINQCKIDLDY